MVSNPWAMITLALFVVLGLWIHSTRTQKHEAVVVFDEAVSVFSGLDVRVDGIDAGKVKKVKHEDGKALVYIGIDEDRYWPLKEGTTATLRFGTTVGNGTRIIDLEPGKGARDLPKIDGKARIANAMSNEAVEFDQILDTFTKETRKDLQGFLRSTGQTFGPRPKALGDGITATAPAFESLGGLADDLSRDSAALKSVVVNGDRVTRALASRRGEIANLITFASRTFNAFASNTDGITQSLDRLPTALQESRTTLARLDGSVDRLDGLFTDLKPGARELASLGSAARPALNELRATVPQAVRTFRAARTSAPQITQLLRQAQPFADLAAPDLEKLAPILACIRPYAPEAAALLTQWGSFNQHYDTVGHYGRIWPNTGPGSVTTSTDLLNAKQFTDLGLSKYALIRAPGYNGGAPQYIEECGYTKDGTDPAKDPDHRGNGE